MQKPADPDALPSHLINLVSSEWAVWRWFVLRGAGFPAKLLFRLSNSECGRSADRLIAAEAKLDQTYRDAAGAVSLALDELRLRGTGDKDTKVKACLKALHQVSSRKIGPQAPVLAELREPIGHIGMAVAERDSAWSAFQSTFRSSIERQSRELQKLACDPRLQEAVIWQNRHAFESGFKQVAERAASSGSRNKKQRQHEELVANYLQRYCAKNDTIGFFGPVAWGEIVPGEASIEVRLGESLVRTRNTYFESWAIDALASRFSSMPGLKWWTAPRLVPYFHVEGNSLHSPAGKPIQLDCLSKAILSRCDGQRLAIEIAQALERDSAFSGISKEKIGELLHSFVQKGFLVWRLSVPVEVSSEVNLRRQLQAIAVPELTAQAISELEHMDHLRQRVHAAAGNPSLLNAALTDLESAFESIAQAPSKKAAGVTYGARTVIYEDCQRDLNLNLAPFFFEPILPALTLLLKSLRWLVQSTGVAFYDVLLETYHELAETLGKPEIALATLWMAIRPKVKETPPDSVTQIERRFKRKWSAILQLPEGGSTIERQARLLEQDVQREFPEVACDFNAGYYCPDIMVAAANPDVIRAGKALYILGELHLGLNTLTSALFVAQHANSRQLVDAVVWDNPGGTFHVLNSPSWDRVTTRTTEGIFCAHDFLLAATDDSVPPSHHSAHAISDLIVKMREGRLVVATRDQHYCFEVLDAFSQLLHSYVMNQACWFEKASHIPRVTIDRLVIQRESWSVSVHDMKFVEEGEEEHRYLGARQWRMRRNLPRVVFIKSPIEVKPFYVDFDSPIYVEILCKTVRRLKSGQGLGAEVAVSEMLPLFSELWLADAAGEGYTSEFRTVMVDLKARSERQRAKERRQG